ncbi:hypothetical protein RW092_23345, partial [Paenibacillus sp. 3LSP]|uniref:hypothetical protein n=1 Tax=Paenibacillus sp. 3LSP TaxID=2800795 RepID=UPI0028FD0D8B
QETVVLVMPKATSGVARIDVYYNFLDVGHYPVNDSYVADSPWDDNVYRNIRIEKREDILEIIVNGVGVYRGRLELNNLPGGILLRKGSNAGTPYTIKDFKFYAGKYRQYVPTLTESEMWGPYTNEDYSTKP